MGQSKVIIANISGFYGDRMSAPQEMLAGGPVDYLTGDYLAELTMAILYKSKLKNKDLGYAKTFLKQMESIMGPCLDKRVKVVVNAGGLNPSGLAEALEGVARTLGLSPKIAYITGDDLMPRISTLREAGAVLTHLDKGISLKDSGLLPVSANAYLGCWGIVEALQKGSDIVVTGRVSDTSVVMGPAAYHFGWGKEDWDHLAGAAIAGHIIECSGQAAGGNYSYFKEVPTYKNVGFPIAEISADGSCVITKHPDTGGLINIGTVTSQLMYEINAPQYITPDVVAHFDTINISQEAKDRVMLSGIKGTNATSTSKVTVNCMDGFQNAMTFQIVGLDHEEKVAILKESIVDALGGEDHFQELLFHYIPSHQENPVSNEVAMSQLKVSVKDGDAQKAGRFFTSKMIEMALCMVPGVCWSSAPAPAKPRITHFPALIDKDFISQKVHIQGETLHIDEVKYNGSTEGLPINDGTTTSDFGPTKEAYLGEAFAARSGDKGGNANLGIWGKCETAYHFLYNYLTVEKVKELLPDTATFEIIRYEFPNLFGLNFYIKGLLQEGVAASTRIDPQAKTLGEYLRAKKIDLPISLLS